MPKMTKAEREEELDVLKMIAKECYDENVKVMGYLPWKCGFIHATARIDGKKYTWCVAGFQNIADPEMVRLEIGKLDPQIVKTYINWD